MIFREPCWVAIVALGGAFACAQAETPAVVGERVPTPVIEEIQRRRAIFESPTAGSSFEAAAGEDATEFAEAIQRAAEQEAEQGESKSPNMSDLVPQPDARGRFAAALREAARVLEATAADLEDVAAYQDADELRNRAAQLRFDAREALSLTEKCPAE